MKKLACLLLALGACGPLSASAAPDPYYHTTSVAWIVRTRNNIDVDDKYVTIIGHVTRRISDEEYWFTDGTGQVRLDSENFDLPIGRRIVIGGRIDQAYLGFGHLEVDVRRWRYAAPYRPRYVHTTTDGDAQDHNGPGRIADSGGTDDNSDSRRPASPARQPRRSTHSAGTLAPPPSR